MDGGAGSDILTGGLGIDELTGGAGGDIFRVTELGDDNLDHIMDFDGTEDVIDLSALIQGAIGDVTDLGDVGDFVSVESDGADTTIKVDSDGGGDSFEAAAVLEGVQTDLSSLVQEGNLTLV